MKEENCMHDDRHHVEKEEIICETPSLEWGNNFFFFFCDHGKINEFPRISAWWMQKNSLEKMKNYGNCILANIMNANGNFLWCVMWTPYAGVAGKLRKGIELKIK